MKTELQEYVGQIDICDTHEHMCKQDSWESDQPDVLTEIFDNYVLADFVTAGLPEKDKERLKNSRDPDVSGRFKAVESVWKAIQFTGYGEACRLIARRFFGIEEMTSENLVRAQESLSDQWDASDRLRILRDEGGFHHIQTDDFSWVCERDESGPEFFLYDLSWATFCSGTFDLDMLREHTEVEVTNLDTLKAAMEALFARYGRCAIAVKSQHAYNRTLAWKERTESEVSTLLQKRIQDEELSTEEKNCIGDWCWARGVEHAIEHNLPFKIHTGYYAGYDRMPVDFIRAGNLCPLLAKYPEARFVLMHISYPYQEELVALAKHYRNVWVDMCWAWSINPLASKDFLRRFLHAAPINKLFAFGGDTSRPRAAVAYSIQARDRISQALQQEIDGGEISENQATAIAQCILHDNQLECFDYDGRIDGLNSPSS